MNLLLILALVQDLKPDYTKEAAKINKEYAKQLLDLVATPLKAKRYGEARQDLAKIIALDPEAKSAKDALEKIRDRKDEGPEDDKKYGEAKKKLRESVAEKFMDLAQRMRGKKWTAEAQDAQGRARALWSEVDLGGKSAAQVMLKRLNQVRTALGLPAVELDETLCKGCDLHALYLVNNSGNPKLEGLGMHKEDPTLVGYTEEGAKAGMASVITAASPDRAVDGWIDTFLHRIPLLDPKLQKIGAGHAAGGQWGNECLIDVLSNNDGTVDPKLAVLAYPPDGAKGVGLEFHGEWPDPIPAGANRPTGYPITLSFFAGQKVTEVTAELHEGLAPKGPKAKPGKAVEFHLSTPEKPAAPDDDKDNSNSICLLPKSPLTAATTYTVKITAKVDDAPFETTWSFTTK